MLFQISLTRVFSFVSWHHLGFMVISVALLGFAVSGVALQLWPGLGTPATSRASAWASAAGLGMVAALWLVARLPFDPTHLGDSPGQVVLLVVVYGALVIPFAAAGLVVITLLRGYAASVGSLYASDLVGAGAGSLVAIWGLGALGAPGVVLLSAAAAFASAALLVETRNRRWSLVGAAALTFALAGSGAGWVRLLPTDSKAMVSALDSERFPGAEIAWTGWNAISRVDVIEGSGLVTWSVNPAAPVLPGPQSLILIDGDAGTPILHRTGAAEELGFLDWTLSSVAPQAFRPQRVLVIGSGGGIDVATALRHGAERIDAGEVNPLIAGLVRGGRYAALGGDLFADPRVALHVDDGRSFVRRSAERYDLVQLSLIDTWAASMSGAYSLSEGYLYTVEAFQDYVQHLTPDGVLSMTRWLATPPREALRVCAVASAALEDLGVADPAACVVVLQCANMANTLVKRTPFTRQELERLQGVAAARGLGFVHLPGALADNDLSRFFAADDRAGYLAAYSHQVTPTRDDSPFFFQFSRWSDLLAFDQAWSTGNSSGRVLLLLVLAQAGALSLVLLVLPLWARRRGGQRPSTPWRALAYFAGLGLGFMLLEVSLMQRYTLFLGSPTYAFALVLATLLVGAGVGSALSSRLQRRAPLVFGGLVVLVLCHAWIVPHLLGAALEQGALTRAALSAVTIFPLGVLLGVPFPLAMARLSAREDSVVGWAWAANGCTSVVGPVLAVLLAIDVGFTAVHVAAALVYAGVFLALPAAE
jgi:hypothetical protein